VALVLAALVLTIGLGSRLTPQEEPSAPRSRASPSPFLAGVDPFEPSPAWHTLDIGGVPLSFRLPEPSWELWGERSVTKSTVGPQGAEAIVFWTTFPGGEHVDPCATLLSPSGTSAADLAAAVATAPGTENVAGPSDATVGGRPATNVTLNVRRDTGCDPGFFFRWPHGECRGACWLESSVGDTIRVWIADVDGTLLFIEAATKETAGAQLDREIRQIVRSIRFDEPTLADLRIAERFMQARSEHDAGTALSLLAEDGATARMQADYLTERHMPSVRMDRNQLALALEAERLYGVVYDSTECRWDPDPVIRAAPIVCTYRMDNRLRQILGYEPVTSSASIGIRDERVTHLSFPWLNVGYPSATPPELAEFVAWIGAEHPEAGRVYDDGVLFRTMGQELVLILTRKSVDLLATYLEEYERSVRA
jgi:hypothetical protein